MINKLRDLFFLTVGAAIAAAALEYFLVPNNIIDGGIVGISIMCHTIFQKPLGLFIFGLNIPFIFLALQKFGKVFVFNTFWAISCLSVFVTLMKRDDAITHDVILSSVFGGLILGIGVGLILRNNGSLDGTEIISIRLAKKIGFSIGELIMFFNIFIFLAAAFLYGPDRAMYSMLTYFIAYRVIDVVLEGLNESKSVMVVTDYSKEIGDKIIAEMDCSVTYIDAIGGYSGVQKQIVYCVISRLEIIKLKQLVKSVDPTAFIAIENVHEVEGVRIKKGHKNRA